MGTSGNTVYLCINLNHPCIYSDICKAKYNLAAPSSREADEGEGEVGQREVEKKIEFNFTMRGKKEQVAYRSSGHPKASLALKITLP